MGKGFAKNMILHAEVDQSLHELITLFVTWCKKMSLDSCASFLEFQLEFTSASAGSLERSFPNCLRQLLEAGLTIKSRAAIVFRLDGGAFLVLSMRRRRSIESGRGINVIVA
jgi:hypothetical protein